MKIIAKYTFSCKISLFVKSQLFKFLSEMLNIFVSYKTKDFIVCFIYLNANIILFKQLLHHKIHIFVLFAVSRVEKKRKWKTLK